MVKILASILAIAITFVISMPADSKTSFKEYRIPQKDLTPLVTSVQSEANLPDRVVDDLKPPKVVTKRAKAPTPKPKAKVVIQKPKQVLKLPQKISPKPVVHITSTSVAAAKAYALGQVGPTQYHWLYLLWYKESHWNPREYYAPTGAYGIPQAVPGSKMASAGSDWRTNPITQVKWGLSYIEHRYGTPYNAWMHSVRYNWY